VATQVHVELNVYVSERIFNGRQASKKKGKAKIPSVPAFNGKMIFIRERSKEGCPFALSAIEKLDNRIEQVTLGMLKKTKVVEGYRYSGSRADRALELDYEKIRIDVSKFDASARSLVNALVVYDQLAEIFTVDQYKRTGKIQLYQRKMHTYRKGIRGCMLRVFHYQDYQFRGVLTEEQKRSSEYESMAEIFGEISEEKKLDSVVNC